MVFAVNDFDSAYSHRHLSRPCRAKGFAVDPSTRVFATPCEFEGVDRLR